MIGFLLFGIAALATTAQTAPPSPETQKADELFQAQKWEEAATAYEAITRTEPKNGRAWMRLGYSQISLKKYEQALGAFQQANEILATTPRASLPMYAIGSAYALMKDKDKAFEWLNKAMAAKFPQPASIGNDPNLVALSDDPRFKDLLALAAKAARVCMNTPEYRGFDFWVGDWNVVGKNGQQLGTNKVVMLAEGCIIEENWDGGGGGGSIGKSFNFYNPVTKKWHQSYMDSNGGNWMMDGELKDGVLRYEGAIYSPNGKVLVHMTFYNMGPDKVRQTAETSVDDGKTWTSTWDGTYIRKK